MLKVVVGGWGGITELSLIVTVCIISNMCSVSPAMEKRRWCVCMCAHVCVRARALRRGSLVICTVSLINALRDGVVPKARGVPNVV